MERFLGLCFGSPVAVQLIQSDFQATPRGA